MTVRKNPIYLRRFRGRVNLQVAVFVGNLFKKFLKVQKLLVKERGCFTKWPNTKGTAVVGKI